MKRIVAILLVISMIFAMACTAKNTAEEKPLIDTVIEAANKSSSMWELLSRLFPDHVIYKDVLGNFTKEAVNKDLALDEFDWDNNLDQAVKGIDVSYYQGNINWEKVANAGIKFAIIRSGYRGYTEGVLQTDTKFEYNIKEALSNDIKVGVYFVTKAISKEEAIEEANYVIDQIKPYKITYPVVIDIEPTSNSKDRTAKLTASERTDYVLAFCDKIEEAGYTPMIYGGVGTYMKYLEFSRTENIDRWFAQYFNSPFLRYKFQIWQATDKGVVNGINGDVDIDYAIVEY